jgi:hypothetical protein
MVLTCLRNIHSVPHDLLTATLFFIGWYANDSFRLST